MFVFAKTMQYMLLSKYIIAIATEHSTSHVHVIGISLYSVSSSNVCVDFSDNFDSDKKKSSKIKTYMVTLLVIHHSPSHISILLLKIFFICFVWLHMVWKQIYHNAASLLSGVTNILHFVASTCTHSYLISKIYVTTILCICPITGSGDNCDDRFTTDGNRNNWRSKRSA